MMNRWSGVWIHVYLTMICTGCSVAMALSGNPEPNFDAFEVGSTRKQVEIQLGRPVVSEILSNGHSKETYEFEMGNSPNGHRAVMNFYIDLVTILIWELPATIIEARMGEDQKTIVVYDQSDRVVSIEGFRPPEPTGALKESIEAHEKIDTSPAKE